MHIKFNYSVFNIKDFSVNFCNTNDSIKPFSHFSDVGSLFKFPNHLNHAVEMGMEKLFLITH